MYRKVFEFKTQLKNKLLSEYMSLTNVPCYWSVI